MPSKKKETLISVCGSEVTLHQARTLPSSTEVLKGFTVFLRSLQEMQFRGVTSPPLQPPPPLFLSLGRVPKEQNQKKDFYFLAQVQHAASSSCCWDNRRICCIGGGLSFLLTPGSGKDQYWDLGLLICSSPNLTCRLLAATCAFWRGVDGGWVNPPASGCEVWRPSLADEREAGREISSYVQTSVIG